MKSRSLTLLCGMLLAAFAIKPLFADEPAKDMRPIICLDEKNFFNKTDNQRANFSALIDRVSHEFVQTGLYRVMNMHDIGVAMSKDEVFKTISDEEGNKIAIPCPALIVKYTVLQYGVNKIRSIDPVTGSRTGVDSATIEVILSITDARTGMILVSKNLPPISSGMERQTGYGASQRGNYMEQALQNASREVAKLTVMEAVLCAEFYVIDTEGGVIEVDVPRSIAKPGDVFTVYRLGKKRLIRRTGKYSQKKIPVGRIQLVSCDEDTSKARPYGPLTGPIDENCIVQMTRNDEGLPAPQGPPPPPPLPGARPF